MLFDFHLDLKGGAGNGIICLGLAPLWGAWAAGGGGVNAFLSDLHPCKLLRHSQVMAELQIKYLLDTHRDFFLASTSPCLALAAELPLQQSKLPVTKGMLTCKGGFPPQHRSQPVSEIKSMQPSAFSLSLPFLLLSPPSFFVSFHLRFNSFCCCFETGPWVIQASFELAM